MDKNNMKNVSESPIRSIYSYQEVDIKETIRKSKNLDPMATRQIAEAIYHEIQNDLTDSKSRTLLLHAPSSAFARKQKKLDHMAVILEKIKDRAGNRVDICLHAFIIDVDKRKSQHEKNKIERIKDSKSRYRILFTFHRDFINSYDFIYILDDVMTTGATMLGLMDILSRMLPASKQNVRGITFCH